MFHLSKKVTIIGVLGIILVVTTIALGVHFGLKSESKSTTYVGGVVTNGYECAEIGASILQKGGTAVDAAIAALFCEGVGMPQSTGIGGGFLMTIYIKSNNTIESLNAREQAPLAAYEDMFHGNASLAYKGGLSIAVPGELRGYWDAHKRFGLLPWHDLVQPTIDLCRKGHRITEFLDSVFVKAEDQIRKDPGLRKVFINLKTNSTYKVGEYVKREKLADTLEIIARDGADALYNGVLTQPLVDDIKKANGIITKEDLLIYKPIWNKPLVAKLPGNQTLYTSPLPGSGVILTFILNILQDFLDTSDISNIDNWQKIVESYKYAYAKRTDLGDVDFVDGIEELIANLTSPTYARMIRNKITLNETFDDPTHYGANYSLSEDHGTAHISVLAPNGDAVSVTGTINQIFGSGILSESTGIVLNDEMDDFSAPGITNNFGVPPSPANFIRPKKHPLSSMCPSIVVDKNGDVVLIVGAAGGTKITTSTAMVLMRHLWFNEGLSDSINAFRLHHQLAPMRIDYERDFDQHIREELTKIGHAANTIPITDGFAAVISMSKRDGVVVGSVDRRRGGSVCLI